MRGQYHAKHGGNPRRFHRSDRDAASARLFLCAECRVQALICSCCDRGQIYCAGDCGPLARRRNQQAAGARYQTSHRGRRAHANRTRRYRAKHKKVTHHGSPAPPPDDCLPPGSRTIASGVTDLIERLRRPVSHCHWCGRRCPDLVRQGFRRRRGRQRRHGGTGHGHGDTS